MFEIEKHGVDCIPRTGHFSIKSYAKGEGPILRRVQTPIEGTPFEEGSKPRNGLRTIGVSGKKGGQGWGETLVITMVEQGAGYYPHLCMPGPSAPGVESP